jgi:hypothetical protein
VNFDHRLAPAAPILSTPVKTPASATPRLTTKAPMVIQAPIFAAAMACCVARSAYGAKK